MSEQGFPSACVRCIERVVICKSALPWAGGVKLGKQERKRGRGKIKTDRGV